MLDNLIVNIKTVLPIAKANTSTDRNINMDYAYDESTVAFIERNITSKLNSNENSKRSTMDALRSYFTKFYRKPSIGTSVDLDNNRMLPRVYNHSNELLCDLEPIELKASEKFIEDIDNVIDKFARVISVSDTNSPRRNANFYVHTFSTHIH